MRTFVIGDIHGCFDELIQLEKVAGVTSDDLIIAVGDVVDRGCKSKEVYHYLKTRPNTIVLVGNHERKHLNGVLSYAQEIVKVQLADAYPAFLGWVATLPYYYETPEAIIVHAAFEHDKSLYAQKEEVLCGATAGERYLEKKYGPERYWDEFYTGEKPIIYGHHVVGNVAKVYNNTYGIDTGACHGGYLTAVELPGFKIHSVQAKEDYWKQQQKAMQLPVLKAKDWGNMDGETTAKQLDRLSYIEDNQVRAFLDDVRENGVKLEALRTAIYDALLARAKQMSDDYPDTFTAEANKLPFGTYLFKARSGRLSREDITKTLDTPNKVKTMAMQLGVDAD